MSQRRLRFSAAAAHPNEWPRVGGYFMSPGGEFAFSGADEEPDVAITVGFEDGGHYLREVRITARDARSQITDQDLRILTRQRAEQWIQWVMANLPAFQPAPDGSIGDALPREASPSFFDIKGAVRRARTAVQLAEVARIYRAGGRRGAQAVATHFGIKHRTAQLWVRAARDAGELGEARRGTAGEAE